MKFGVRKYNFSKELYELVFAYLDEKINVNILCKNVVMLLVGNYSYPIYPNLDLQ